MSYDPEPPAPWELLYVIYILVLGALAARGLIAFCQLVTQLVVTIGG